MKNVEKTLVALSAHVKNRIEQNTCSNLAKSPTTLCLFSPLLSVLSALLQGGAPKLKKTLNKVTLKHCTVYAKLNQKVFVFFGKR